MRSLQTSELKHISGAGNPIMLHDGLAVPTTGISMYCQLMFHKIVPAADASSDYDFHMASYVAIVDAGCAPEFQILQNNYLSVIAN